MPPQQALGQHNQETEACKQTSLSIWDRPICLVNPRLSRISVHVYFKRLALRFDSPAPNIDYTKQANHDKLTLNIITKGLKRHLFCVDVTLFSLVP